MGLPDALGGHPTEPQSRDPRCAILNSEDMRPAIRFVLAVGRGGSLRRDFTSGRTTGTPMTTTIPADGDVIVHKLRGPATAGYGVAVYRGEVQFIGSSRQEMLARAASFARHIGVDVWYTSDDRRYDREMSGRPALETSLVARPLRDGGINTPARGTGGCRHASA
jgi:hypothetical protein